MRRMLLIVGGVVTLLLLLAAGVLQALKTSAVQMRVAAAVSDALDRPVTIGRLGVTILPRPSLTATEVRVGGADSAAAPGIAIASLRAFPRWSSLLPGRTITVTRVDLLGLVLSARRDSTGHWHLPLARRPAADSTSRRRGLVVADLRVHDGSIRLVDDRLRDMTGAPTVTNIAGVDARMRVAAGEVTLPSLSGRLGATEVTGAAGLGSSGGRILLRSASIRPRDLPQFMTLLGMHPYPGLTIAGPAPFAVTVTFAPGAASHTATGHITMEQVKLNKLDLGNVEAPFRFSGGVLTVDPLQFTAYGGREQGVVAVDLNQPVAAYTFRGNLRGLEAALLLRSMTASRDIVTGMADVSGSFRGRGHTAADVKRSLNGKLGFELRNGVLRNFPIAAALNQALGVTEGTAQDTKFELLSGTATIASGRARSDDLVLRAGELTLAGGGTLGFDHSLSLRLTANFSPALSSRLVRQVGVLKRLQNARGQVAIPVTVSGTTTAPRIAVDAASMAKRQLEGELAKGLMQLLDQR